MNCFYEMDFIDIEIVDASAKKALSRKEWAWMDKSEKTFSGGGTYPWASGEPSLTWMDQEQTNGWTSTKPIAGSYCVSLSRYPTFKWDDKLCANSEKLLAVCRVRKGRYYLSPLV